MSDVKSFVVSIVLGLVTALLFQRRVYLRYGNAMMGQSRMVALAFAALTAMTAFAAEEKVGPQVEYFPLSAIRLTGGPLQAQQELNRRYLLQLEPDRLLCNYRVEAGLDPKAPTYRGWEANRDHGFPIPGHMLGFYMSGAAFTYEATGDEELKKRLLYVVDELAEVQKATGGVVLATLGSNRVMKEISNGDIRNVTGGSFNGLNEPTYIMNKVLLGLYQIHVATGSAKARDVYLRFCDWFGVNVIDRLSDAQLQKLLVCEHGSLPENYCDAYLLTGDAKYVRWARRLCQETVIAPLAAGDAKFLDGRHANCHIPKYTSCERVWRLTGEERLHRAALNAWDDIVGRRLWAIGANCTSEHFFDPLDFEKKLLGNLTGPESCNSVNMLRQTEALYRNSPEARRMDFYERCLFNHLLSNHDPERGMVVYNTSMKPGAYRFYSDPFDSMWCCTGTGLEVPGKLGKMIYARSADDRVVYLQLFAPSTLDWKSRGVKLRQETRFPYEQGTTLVVESAPADAEFTLNVRHPAWVADAAFAVTVNGAKVSGESKAGSYFAITRKWKAGDRVRVELPMTLKFEPLPHSRRFGAFVCGPIVLAGELGRQGLVKTDFWEIAGNSKLPSPPAEPVPFPVADSAEDILKAVQPVEGEPLHFRTVGFVPKDVRLSPFFEVHFQRYAIYWELMVPSVRASYEAERARQAEQDKFTVDRVIPHDAASEKAHGLAGANTFSGTGLYDTRHHLAWRDARNDAGGEGWFSYRLKVTPQARLLRAWYYGMERNARTFDVLVDGTLVRTESLGNVGVDGLVARDMPLSEEQLKGKREITVAFRPRKGNIAGGLFDLRVLSGGEKPNVVTTNGGSAKVGGFWREELRRQAMKWIPHCIREMEKGGRGEQLLNLVAAGEVLAGKNPSVKFKGEVHADAYPYNTVEAICLALQTDLGDDAEWRTARDFLRAKLEEWIPIILAAQERSGYIHSYHVLTGKPHFANVDEHELYVMGYFIEMGIAHMRLTGGTDRRLFDAAIRCADHLDATFGPAPKRTWMNGHPGIEYAFLRLADAVNRWDGAGKGDRYARLAQFFVRNQHAKISGPGIHGTDYNQSDRPAESMREARGHAVRACYFSTAMEGIGRRLADRPLAAAADRLFDSLVDRKYYLTGAVGATRHGEAFGPDYDLPQEGYCESCAGCGLAFWCLERAAAHLGVTRPWDVYERVLYNNVLGAVSQDGFNFYYQNPLASSKPRYPWHSCPCCVGNIPRTLFALKDNVVSVSADGGTLYVNNYLDIETDDFKMETGYPNDGKVKFTVKRGKYDRILARFPNRSESKLYRAEPAVEHGYREVKGEWTLPLPEQTVTAVPEVKACAGLQAFQRGPIVYSWEGPQFERKVPNHRRLNAGGESRVWLPREWKRNAAAAYSPASVVFDSPAETDRGAMFLGDGEVGALAWISADGTLHTMLQSSDSLDEAGRHVKIGQIDYETKAPVDAGSYRQELSLERGDFNATWKSAGRPVSVHYRVQWGDARLAVCEIDGAPNASARNVNWRFFPGGFMEKPAKDLGICFKYGSDRDPADRFTLAVSADRALAGLPAGMFGWCHVNCNATADKLFKFVDETQGLEGLGRPRLLNDRVFGAITRAERSADKTLFLTAVTCCWPCDGEADWRQRTLGVLANRGWPLADEASRRAAHVAGWRTFWDRSHIEVSRSATVRAEGVPVPVPYNTMWPIRFGTNVYGGNRFSGTCSEARLVIDGKAVFSGRPTVGQRLVEAPVSVRGEMSFSCTFRPANVAANMRLLDNMEPFTSHGFLIDLQDRRLRIILGTRTFFHPVRLVADAEAKVEVEVSSAGDVVAVVNGDRRKLADPTLDRVETCSAVNLAWASQRYTTRLAGKGALPIRFNGSIFTARKGGDPEYRKWGYGLFWQNERLPYYPMFAAGDLELTEALFRAYAYDLLDFEMKRTRRYLGHGGAYFPECMQPWGDHFVGNYGTGSFDGRADKLQESRYHKYAWVGQLELSQMMICRYLHTEDVGWFRTKALPAIREYVRYFDEHYPIAADGRYDWQPAQAIETWWDCTAPMTEVAGLTRVTELLLALPEDVVGEGDRALFAKIRSRIPKLPVRRLEDGTTVYAPAAKFDRNRHNFETPELYCVFPFRLCSFEKPNAELGRRTYTARDNRLYFGWAQDELFAANLGLAGEARRHFVNRVLTNSAPGFRWPACWGPNYDWTPDQDHGGNLQNIIQSMLLQFEGRKIFLAPAWPKDWNCSFKLHAPFKTTVEGRIEDGRIQDLAVTPSSRRADVVICL